MNNNGGMAYKDHDVEEWIGMGVASLMEQG